MLTSWIAYQTSLPHLTPHHCCNGYFLWLLSCTVDNINVSVENYVMVNETGIERAIESHAMKNETQV